MSCPIEIKPFAQAAVTNPATVFNLNYASQDFYSLKTRLTDYILERFGPNGTELPNTFNDFIESSIAIMLIENWAFIADLLSFKIDQIVNELFIDTVTEVENAFRISMMIGFKPTPPIAARTLWIARINNPLSTDIRIVSPVRIDVPAETTPTRIELFAADSNNNPLFDEDIIIPAGATLNKNIIGIEGRTIEEEFTGTGEIAQTVALSFSPVIYDSVRVEVDGNTWNAVEYFTDSQPRKEFRVEYNSDYQAFIMFGNNRTGMIPSPGSRIRITYRVGGGQVGNIVTGFVETQKQVAVAGLDFTVPISYRNYTKGENGYDGDTIEDIRRKLPRWLKTQNRAVTGEDYKTLTDQFITPYHGQIGKSTVILRNHGCAGNIVDIYVLAKDGSNLTEASPELKVDLSEELDSKKMITDHVCIKDGVVLKIDVTIDVTVDKFYRKFEREIKENLTRRVDSFFGINNWDYNQILRDTDLIKEMADIREIQNFQVTFVTEDGESSTLVSPKFYEIVRPDTIEISFVYN